MIPEHPSSPEASPPLVPAAATVLDERRLRLLLDIGRAVVAELDLETVLEKVLAAARELTGARYAAIGVLAPDRHSLERFVTSGIDPDTRARIGEPPHGRGILGVLIEDPRALRLADVGAHSRSYGFPLGHPPMTTFLGVPVLIRGESWGNLYLTDKDGGDEFEPQDEEAMRVLAVWAAIAIDNARLYQAEHQRRGELERAVRALETTTEIARAVGGETQLDRVLELVVKRGRALVEARVDGGAAARRRGARGDRRGGRRRQRPGRPAAADRGLGDGRGAAQRPLGAHPRRRRAAPLRARRPYLGVDRPARADDLPGPGARACSARSTGSPAARPSRPRTSG